MDVDLSPEQFAAKVSRQQARLFLKSDGAFRLANTGRRKFLVNNCQARPCLFVPCARLCAMHPALLNSQGGDRRGTEAVSCKPPTRHIVE